MYNIYLLRHGETVWNTEKRLQGHQDSPLTRKGREQAFANGTSLRKWLYGKPYRFLASPLGRCRETAQFVARALEFDVNSIEYDDRLKETCYGDWEGKTKSEIRRCDADRLQKRISDRWNVATPNGESYSDVARRLTSWLSGLDTGNVDIENIVVVSHGCAGRILRGVHSGLDHVAIAELDESHESIYRLTQSGDVEKLQ